MVSLVPGMEIWTSEKGVAFPGGLSGSRGAPAHSRLSGGMPYPAELAEVERKTSAGLSPFSYPEKQPPSLGLPVAQPFVPRGSISRQLIPLHLLGIARL